MSNFFEAEISDLSHDGRGIAHINGKATFISGALPSEIVKAQYTNKRSQFDEAKIVDVIQASPERTTPPCQHFGLCGGCSLQHLSPTLQIQHKQAVLLNHLKHFGHLSPETVLAPLTGASIGYRRKARLGVKYVIKKQRLLVGFREKNGRMLADLEQCEILDPRVGKHLTDLAKMIRSLEHYDEIAQIEVAIGDEQVALIFRNMQPLTQQEHQQLMDFGAQFHFDIYLQPAGPASVHKIWPTDQQERLYYDLPAQQLRMHFHPADFTQINAEINQKMLTQALTLLDLQPEDKVLDLFCGLGNFTLPIAQLCSSVTGVEGEAAMTSRAAENAAYNKLSNMQFYTANLMEDVTGAPWFKTTYDKILLDPPRAGAQELVKHIAKLKAKRIVYVSCHPGTLARDAEILVQQGYRLISAGVMDMFPHTEHVESMALFEINTR